MAEGRKITPKKLRAKKKVKTTFRRQNHGRTDRKRVKGNWRKPRGVDNKQREHLVTAGHIVSIGYRNAKDVRGLHPSGYEEVRVFNTEGLEGLGKHNAVRIAGSVGKKKRKEIIAKAGELGLKVLNK